MLRRCVAGNIIVFFIVSFTFVKVEGIEKKSESTEPPASPHVARVLQCNGPVEVDRPDEPLVSPGMYLSAGDTLTIPAKTQLSLLFQDGTIHRFEGPATIDLRSGFAQSEKGMMSKLAASLKDLLFSEQRNQQDARLGVRQPRLPAETALKVPRPLVPIPGAALLQPPDQFRWQPVQGVFLYSVSLFDSNQRLWVKETKNNSIDLSESEVNLVPGNNYLWIVEAVMGNSFLRSETASFEILDERQHAQLSETLTEIESSATDELMGDVLRLHVYRDFQLKNECYLQAERILESSPGDYTALMVKAQLLEEMGLYDQALKIYKAVLVR